MAGQEALLDEVSRQLQSAVDESTAEDAVRVTKIFSGIFFAGLAGWLSMANGTKLSFIQQAALEKRLTVCCFLGVYVGAFSAFFNFFQLTEVDDVLLDRGSAFTLDFSRPLEWIMTCPLMQLALVLMGGSRIPEYRRMVMPGLSVIVLCCGTASMLLWDVFVYIAYGVGLCFAGVMFFLNRQQIIEHSDGQECLMYGDSEFRKASILLIVTWIPFPTFYALSPEGFGVINDVLFVQVGWAFLNIVSKFTFIFYIQRIKDNYCNRLKVKREFAGVQNAQGKAAGGAVGPDGTITPPLSGMDLVKSKQQEKATGEMGALVVETMNFLGMAQNSDRFLRLLQKSQITSLSRLETVTQEECIKLQVPWDLVAAVQKRLRVWRLEMQDEAELALEQGELHYQMEEPVNKQALADKMNQLQAMGQMGPMGGQASPGHQPSPISYTHPPVQMPLPGMVDEPRIARLEETLMALQQQNETIQQQNDYFQTEVLRRLSEQQQHLMQQPVGQSTQQTAAQMQQSQMLQQQLQQYENFQTEVMRRLSDVGADSPKAPSSLRNTIELTVAATLKNKEMESLFEHRIEELVCAAQVRIEQAADKVSDSLRAQVREVQGNLERSRESESSFIQNTDEKMKAFMAKTDEKLHGYIEKSDEHMQSYIAKTDEKMQAFMAKTDEKMQVAVEDVNKSAEYTRRILSDYLKEARTANESRNDSRRQEDMERNFARKLEDSNAKVLEKQDRVAEFLRGALQNDITTVMSRSDMVVDVVKENGMMVKESLGDLKRLNINALELANSTQDAIQQNIHRSGEIRNAMEGISSQISEMASRGPSALSYGERMGDRSPVGSYREERDRPLTAGGGRRAFEGRNTMNRGIS